MEYCDKGDLDSYIQLQNKMMISENRIWKIIIEICLGLERLHLRGVLHRDLKPKNIFLTRDYEVRLGDFGVSKTTNYR